MVGSGSRYQVLLSGHVGLPWAITAFQPHAVIFGKTDSYPGDVLRAVSGGLTLSIHTEQNILTESEIRIQFMHGHPNERPPNIDQVDYFLLANEATRQALLTEIPEKKLVVVGSTRLLLESFAESSKVGHGDSAIGLVAGPNFSTQNDLHGYFERFIDFPYHETYPFESVEEQISFISLECAWLNHIYKRLAVTEQLIVRPRFGGSNYFATKKNVNIDLHPSPKYLLDNSRVVIYGHSSLGVESQISGVPAISIVKLIRLGSLTERVSSSDFTRHCWQPENFDDLMDLLKQSSRETLPLSPDYSEYKSFVLATYFNYETRDKSLEKILNFLESCSFDSYSNVDYRSLEEHYPPSLMFRLVVRILATTKSVRVYLTIMWYLAMRKRLSRQDLKDTYISSPRIRDIIQGVLPDPSKV